MRHVPRTWQSGLQGRIENWSTVDAGDVERIAAEQRLCAKVSLVKEKSGML